ncbi:MULTISPECIES: YlxQ family RNA-binding protein [Cytobacillus]|uniref:YlxQ family RNA-binding protein n=1 Tax=Cytobacillus stercorigallinarum TaxID=2762240 RepID=A0ABR8QME0_9BACI|nr:YlxQ family RNA-binding protein [Cytobacillus stercorigallinarum]MBD7936684.1 YlxQ family RNA-binding protein [Cytobacillus stercorigallinarum]
MNEKKWMSLLGLANRARKITSGEELSISEIRKGKAKLVLLSADASANTTKKVTDKCKSYAVPYKIVPDRELLGQAIGKEARVVVAVLDAGFAKKLLTLLD